MVESNDRFSIDDGVESTKGDDGYELDEEYYEGEGLPRVNGLNR